MDAPGQLACLPKVDTQSRITNRLLQGEMNQVIEVSLDNSGHILIPSTLQSRLGLLPEMTLLVEKEDNGAFV